MRRKRLQHVADTLCHMFCGWRLINSYRELERLGSGHLSIDALSGNCSFNGSPVEPLSIAYELATWLREDLLAHGIPAESLRHAQLHAELGFSRIDASSRATNDQHIDLGGKPVRKGAFNRVQINCRSEVATDEAVYKSTLSDLEEWPVGWPAG
jgi:hypothetical protein